MNPFSADLLSASSSKNEKATTIAFTTKHRTLVPEALDTNAKEEFKQFIAQDMYSCVGAKSVLATGHLRMIVLPEIGHDDSTLLLAYDLFDFTLSLKSNELALSSYAAIFLKPQEICEICFEELLWQQLLLLRHIDLKYHSWAPTVSDDPASPRFSFSFAETAFFVIGMHGASSRFARKSALPTLVFNAHHQFESLRSRGKMEPMKAAINRRELAWQGTVNPNLSDFGNASEATQYSGSVKSADWRCPISSWEN